MIRKVCLEKDLHREMRYWLLPRDLPLPPAFFAGRSCLLHSINSNPQRTWSPVTLHLPRIHTKTPRPRSMSMEQKSIKSFFKPRDAPPGNTSHKRTATSPPTTSKEPAAKTLKSTEPIEATLSDMKAQSTAVSTQDEHPQPAITTTLHLKYHKGDIFAAPQHSLLIHACNTQGSWGSGIAAAFRARYPAAFKIYRDYCTKTHKPTTNPVPTGTCLLIPPSETSNGKPKHWIGCLFTSAKYGKAKDSQAVILGNTGRSIKHLLAAVKEAERDGRGVNEIRMCMINSGKFGVPWERTVEVLESLTVEEGWKPAVDVWSVD
ncbi:unnamed protein product [Periconia digitata]|uniref:ADP-ribose 1''-phosphate phosphatase n=1 Tax=Periconia digitata TaxID=1303443 RepID=A0A9W4U3V2_9PLEO|nr:unnamed protein product [Periconia digitata]